MADGCRSDGYTDWKDFLSEHANSLARQVGRALQDGNETNSDVLDYFLYRSDILYKQAARLLPRNSDDTSLTKIITYLREVFDIIQEKCLNIESSTKYEAFANYTGRPGRPKISVTRNQLEYFIENGFSGVDVAKMLGISVSTIRRRMTEHNIDTTRPFSKVTDAELAYIVRVIRKECPRSGYRMMQGYLRGKGYNIQQRRVRRAMQEEDPEGTLGRWMSTVHRRVYSVSGPNALWHIDGNHKLIR